MQFDAATAKAAEPEEALQSEISNYTHLIFSEVHTSKKYGYRQYEKTLKGPDAPCNIIPKLQL